MSKALLCLLLAAASVEAQITTSNVYVKVTHCNNLSDLSLVINGDDFEPHRVELERDPAQGPCIWKTNLGAETISTSTAKFSLRANFERTPGTPVEKLRSGCQKAAAKEEDRSAWLQFGCCAKGPFRHVSVTIDPPIPASYVREVRPFDEDGNLGVKCLERAIFAEGQGSISQAKFSGEDVYLNLGPFSRKQPPGLLLNKIADREGTFNLTRDDVAYQMTVQRAKGQGGSAPTLSSNAISLEIKRLADLKLERTRIEVIK